MKFRPVGAEMFHADRIFPKLRTRLKKRTKSSHILISQMVVNVEYNEINVLTTATSLYKNTFEQM
jgi:hypothetical protein